MPAASDATADDSLERLLLPSGDDSLPVTDHTPSLPNEDLRQELKLPPSVQHAYVYSPRATGPLNDEGM
jgi:hypothetical protein